MSAQLSQHVSTRLLIAEKSENSAHALDSSLRDAGIATKLTISDDLAHIAQLICDGEVDLALITDKIDGLDQVIPRIRETAAHVPIILLANPEEANWAVTDALSLGMTDVVPANQPQQMGLVVKRELEHVCQREHFAHVRRALKEAEQRCQLLLKGSKSAIAYVHEGIHIHANEHYLDLFGYNDTDELCAESLVDILSADSAAELKGHLKSIRNGSDEITFEFTSKEIGEGDASKTVTGTMALANSQYEGEDCLQVTVRQEQNASPEVAPPVVTQEAAVAPASDAMELSGFIKAAETYFASATEEPYILVGALDGYAEMQSSYGMVGAETICRRVWQGIVEIASDYPVTRLSNHQYAFAVTAASHDKATVIAEDIRQSVSELMFEVQDKTVRPTLTLSGEVLQSETEASGTLDTAYGHLLALLENDDNNNMVSLPKPQVVEGASESDNARVILRQITEAIEKKNFILLFQPIISLRGDSDEHYEVFLRMTNDDGDQLEPGHFLQTAIDNNVAGKIDRWVILQSIKMLSVHRAKGHATRLTINLTCNSVTDPEFLQWLGVAIKAARLPSDAVIFQITEKDATTYLRQSREFVEGLRNMHCRASLSRFGLIEDPFETLSHLPVDMVKMDGSTLANLETDEAKSDALIATIKKLQGSGKLTVVPMVENANILSTLWQAGANYIQGHYLQEPTASMDYDFSTEE